MKIIKPSVEFFGAVPTDYAGTLAFIEMAGRTCYKSEDKITDSSAEGFVKRLINARHLAMVEHSNFVVRTLNVNVVGCGASLVKKAGKYLSIAYDEEYTYIGGNLTAWAQLAARSAYQSKELLAPFHIVYAKMFGLHAGWENHWQVCPHNEIPPALHRYSAKFICDRGVSHELVRHRPCSFAQESTRYVNYGGKDMEFIEPVEFGGWSPGSQQKFVNACGRSEELYKAMLYGGLKPQQARAVLPNALKTEIIVTADAAEWAHIKKLRTHPSAHPDIQRVMHMLPWEEMGL
jgi:thymidylate synthase (FAD)